VNDPARILIVEDNIIIALEMELQLNKKGYQVVAIASKGEIALQLAHEKRPDIVIMDIALDGYMNGVETASRLKRELKLPVIFITGHNDHSLLKNLRELEPAGYLLKPVDYFELFQIIEIALYRHQMELQRNMSIQWMEAQLELYKMGDQPTTTIMKYTLDKIIQLTNSQLGWVALVDMQKEQMEIILFSKKGLASNLTEEKLPEWVVNLYYWKEAVRFEKPFIINKQHRPFIDQSEGTARPFSNIMILPLKESEDAQLVVTVADEKREYTDLDLQQVRVLLNAMWAIVQQYRSNKALRKSEEQFRKYFELPLVGIAMISNDSQWRDCNQKLCDMLGYQRESLLRKTWFEVTPSEDREDEEKWLKKVMSCENESVTWEKRYLRSDGSFLFAEVSMIAFKQPSGNIDYCLAVIQDITERNEAQQKDRLHEQQLIQTDKMKSLGVLIAGIAHEINNPNNYILINAKLLLRFWQHYKETIVNNLAAVETSIMSIPSDQFLHEFDKLFQGIVDGSQRIKNIVQGLSDFSRPDMGKWDQLLDVNTVIQSACTILEPLIHKSCKTLQMELSPDLPSLKGNFQQLEQVIINLLTNACQSFTANPGTIRIQSRLNAKYSQIEIEIRDNGMGMSEEQLKHIFDPFFTTRLEIGGTGLGMAISFNIIKKFNGQIRYHSQPAQGTQALLVLPFNIPTTALN